jgi:protein TonB
MDFSQKQGFTAERASGIGVVALAHIVLGAALVYALHSTTITKPVDPGQVTFKPLPPLPKQPDPLIKNEPAKRLPTIVIPPIDHPIELPTPLALPPGPIDRGPIIKEGPEGPPAGPGTGPQTTQHTNTTVSTNFDACKPTYPKAALMNEEEGTVRLKLEVGADSRLVSASVLRSSGFTDLDKAALAALSNCTFKAATQDGTPIRSSLVTDYVWSLQQ